MGFLGGVEDGRHAELVLERAAVLFRDVARLDEGGEGLVGFVWAEDEDLRRRDRVEPALDPAPYSREEGRSADDLEEVSLHEHCGKREGWLYEYSVEGFRIVCRRERACVLHVAAQVPELLQTYA